MKKLLFLLSLFILFSCDGQTEKNKKSITSSKKVLSDKKNGEKTLFLKINCNASHNTDGTYGKVCDKLSLSNTSFELHDNYFELITIKFNDIEKAIIRKIENNDLLTSSPYVYFNKENSSQIFFFPLIGDTNFGWKIYYYKDYVLYPLGQRVTYWNSEFEDSKINYGDFLKIYQLNGKISVAIPSKYILKADKEYQNYPDFLDGNFHEKDNVYYFDFPCSQINYYKKYKNGNYEGDYNKMINNKIIDPLHNE